MKDIVYTSNLAPHIEKYIQYRCSLGFSKSTYSEALRRFDRFCAERFPSADSITEDLAMTWAELRDSESENGRIRRLITLNGFSKYLAATGIDTYCYPDGFIGQYKPCQAYLYSMEELKRFFHGADALPIHPVAKNRDLIAPVIFRMHLCCGLRPQETVALQCKDVDLDNGNLYIADSKVHKDRVVAMSKELWELCLKYDAAMAQRLPQRRYFFQRTEENIPLTILWQQQLFRRCIKQAGLCFPETHKPSVYSFRHNFATLVIKKWICEGKSVDAMLPYLSSYMGHSSLEDTAYYIHLVPEHFTQTGLTDWDTIPEVPDYED